MSNPVRIMVVDYLKKILATKVYDIAVETELRLALNLSVRTGNRVYLKHEDDQPMFSLKLRGTYDKMVSLTPVERRRGVITASAGNHAQGVAFSATRMECKAMICMSVITPQSKIDGVRPCGGGWADVVLHNKGYFDTYNHVAKLQEKYGYTPVHPFDDPEVIAGQGTITTEILRQHLQPIHVTLYSIGGGGLISDIAAYVKAV